MSAEAFGPFRVRPVFGLALAVFRARWAPLILAAFLLSYLPSVAQDRLMARLTSQAIGALGGLAYDLLIAALYLELRRVKDGVAVGEIEQVFA